MLHASRLIQCASFLALSTLFCASALHAACRPFAVVGDDASYLQFDPDDWSIQALGNFWNVGVRQVEAIVAGTSFPRPAFITREFVSIFDRQPMIDEPQSPLEGPFAAVVLGANPRPMRHFNGYAWVEATYFQRFRPPNMEWPPPHYLYFPESESPWSPQWVHWLAEDTLLRSFESDGATAVYHLSGELETLNLWDIGGMDLSMPFCAAGDSLYFTDSSASLRVSATGDARGGRRPLAALTGDGYRLAPLHTKNCKALASRPIANDSLQREYALYDIATDTIEAEFASPAPARNILFAGGTRWLQQLAQDSAEFNPTRADSNPSVGTFAGTRNEATLEEEEPVPSNTFRLIDTATGEVLREAELDIPGGALFEEIQCDADTPRAVIGGPRRIWLLDANTLAILAENEIPFERDYFVFE